MADEDFDDRPSKSQRKRDMHALRDLGEELLSIPEDKLRKLSDARIVEAVQVCKKITKGNARKRQLQFIGKLMRSTDVDEVRDLIDSLNAGTRAHVAQFHRLEQWRERLIAEDASAMDEVCSEFPDIDRQQLRQLVRDAVVERGEAREPPVHFRKLFQFLKAQASSRNPPTS